MIEHNFEIEASLAKVYEVLTTQNGYMGWWSKKCRIGSNEGELCHLTFDKQGTIVEMGFRIDKLVPNKKVVWTCVENGNPAWLETVLTFTLEEKGENTSLQFSHAFDPKWEGSEALEMTKQGWKHFMNSLKNYCERNEGQPW